MKDTAARNRIIEATINSIEAYGIEGCTVRNIAKEAGVTLSSVHYYFESKEMLVETALNAAIQGSFEDIEGIWTESAPDYKTALRRILLYLFEGSVRYPGIARAGMRPVIMHGDRDAVFFNLLNGFLGRISHEIADASGKEEAKLIVWLTTAFSAILFLGISSDVYSGTTGMSVISGESRDKIVSQLMEGY